MSEYLTTQELADILRVHRSTIQRMIETGQLPGSIAIRTRNRKTWRIPKSALDELAKKSSIPEPSITKQPVTDLVADPYPDLRRFAKSVR